MFARMASAITALFFLSTPHQAAASCTLRFAWSAWEPFHYRAPDGTMQGLDYELVGEAARRMGCAVLWHEMPRGRAVALLKEGRMDAMAGVTLTGERLAFARFSRPLRPGRNVLLVRKGETGRFPFSGLEQLADSHFRLGSNPASRYSPIHAELVEQGRLDDNAIPVPAEENALTMLLRDRIDGFITGRLIAERMLRDGDMAGRVEIHPMHIEVSMAHVMFSRASVAPEVVAGFNRALESMAADGTLAASTDGLWPGMQSGGQTVPGIPTISTAPAMTAKR
ncbi:substrate-binding periplasmic protein [Indioceanicola profundi]|uniref:substrate-binding periplasmic protein n=1 Tax=Indioceanicola profundi TaxID=2220096 RepID=UPI000E6A9EB9|nr:transporter substrate-binding domain-containing protein [Indioceanicola profundi]